jgi:hypothetical protein
MSVSIHLSGGLFHGNAAQEVHRLARDLEEEIGNQVRADVQEILNRRIVHPTPYYETQISVERSAESTMVTDHGVIYGPWLEGISRRNQSSRFKGYHAFRNTAQQIEGKISRLLQEPLRRMIARLS